MTTQIEDPLMICAPARLARFSRRQVEQMFMPVPGETPGDHDPLSTTDPGLMDVAPASFNRRIRGVSPDEA